MPKDPHLKKKLAKRKRERKAAERTKERNTVVHTAAFKECFSHTRAFVTQLQGINDLVIRHTNSLVAEVFGLSSVEEVRSVTSNLPAPAKKKLVALAFDDYVLKHIKDSALKIEVTAEVASIRKKLSVLLRTN